MTANDILFESKGDQNALVLQHFDGYCNDL